MPNPRILNRKVHRWGAIAVAVPFGIVIATGLLLQVKKQFAWVQPPEQRGTVGAPQVAYEALLDSARARPELAVTTWGDVDRLDVRPSKGLVKLVGTNGWELQADIATGAVLQTAYRRSDLLESLHDGSWFHDQVKLWVFLPSGVLVLLLWGTGLYLFLLPIRVRRAKLRAGASASAG